MIVGADSPEQKLRAMVLTHVPEVLRTLPNENRVIVEGVNMRTRHVKPTQEGESGRIVTEEASLHASNVMLYSTTKKVASRVELITEKDGSKKRRLKKTGEVID